MYNPFTLKNKTILITGASSGIGKSTAIECSKMGAKVIIIGRNQERLETTYNLLQGRGHTMFVFDLKKIEMFDELIENLPELDGLVNNAGIISTIPCNYITESKMCDILSINVNAPILLFSKLMKKKKIKKGASIVFTSSINGTIIGGLGSSVYATTKGALAGFVKSAAIECAQKNIRVNCICPGMINTNIYESGIITDEQLKKDTEKYPLGRYGSPDEVAWSIIFLLSNASSFITGTNIIIDGGFSVQ